MVCFKIMDDLMRHCADRETKRCDNRACPYMYSPHKDHMYSNISANKNNLFKLFGSHCKINNVYMVLILSNVVFLLRFSIIQMGNVRGLWCMSHQKARYSLQHGTTDQKQSSK